MRGMEERGDGSRPYIGFADRETRTEYTGAMVKFKHDYYYQVDGENGILVPKGVIAVVLHDIGYTKDPRHLPMCKHRVAIPNGTTYNVMIVEHPFLSFNLTTKEKKSLRLHRLYALNLMKHDYDNLDIILDR